MAHLLILCPFVEVVCLPLYPFPHWLVGTFLVLSEPDPMRFLGGSPASACHSHPHSRGRHTQPWLCLSICPPAVWPKCPLAKTAASLFSQMWPIMFNVIFITKLLQPWLRYLHLLGSAPLRLLFKLQHLRSVPVRFYRLGLACNTNQT